jgi:hypothetical protein
MTFKACAEQLMDSREAGWRNPKHRQQWRNTLKVYAYPVIGDLPIDEVNTQFITRILEPIWTKKPETASRLRGRIEGCSIGQRPAAIVKERMLPAGGDISTTCSPHETRSAVCAIIRRCLTRRRRTS